MTLSLIIDWSGPFSSIEKAKEAAREFDLGEVLYLVIGKRAYQRITTMQYVGITGALPTRINNQHHVLPEVKQGLSVWVGEIVSHAIAGRKSAKHPVKHSVAVDYAEWALAYFLSLPLNKNKRKNPPPEALILVNRWFKPDFDTRRTHRGHKDWPDFIEYEPDFGFAQLQWFGAPGRRKRFSEADIEELVRKSD